MSSNSRTMKASVNDVWAILADGNSYEQWVVGADTLRYVDVTWPQVGSKLHHTVKAGPATSKDATVVLEAEPDKFLKLRGYARPYGVAEITVELHEKGETSTEVIMHEEVVEGPGSKIPKRTQEILLRIRNARTLQKLAKLAE